MNAGSHWESRILGNDVMSPVSTPGTARISSLTLALFEDSGWYTPDYSKASQFAKGLTWGYKQGCSFMQVQCVPSPCCN